MEIFYANLHYRIVYYLKLLKIFKSHTIQKDKLQFLKGHKYTIIFNSVFYILIPALILLITELIIWFLIMFFLETLINYIPFNMIKPKWLHSLSMFIAGFFTLGNNNVTLYGTNDLKNNLGIIWLFIGSLFLWRSMLLWNMFFESGQFRKDTYQNGLMALICRVFVRCCKFSIVIILWPIFLFFKLPNQEEFKKIPRYDH